MFGMAKEDARFVVYKKLLILMNMHQYRTGEGLFKIPGHILWRKNYIPLE